MSGHSHFSSIKHKKGIADAKRGKAFSKMARVIIVTAKEGGGDPGSNYKLKMAIDQARQINMPKENIERAIRKGTGEDKGEKLEHFVFEAYGPGKIAVIIEGITDNKNRSLSEIKQTLNQYNGKLAGAGSVKWLFERKGTITINYKLQITNYKKEELELMVIEAGAEDIYWDNNTLYIYTKPEELEKVKKNLEEKDLSADNAEIKIESSSLDWVAKETVETEEKEKESCEKLFEALDENDAVQDIYSNLKI